MIFGLVIALILPALPVTFCRTKLPAIDDGKISCELIVRPGNGFMSIADDRTTVSVIITCQSKPQVTVFPSIATRSLNGRHNQSFLLISDELSVTATPEDGSIVHFQPKYGLEMLLVPVFTPNSTAPPIMQPRYPGVHIIKFRPGISQSLQWCGFPKLLGRTKVVFTVKKFRGHENNTAFGELVAEKIYLVKVSRNFRAKDMVFRGAMALASTISSMGIGCGTDIYSVIDILRMRHVTITGSLGLVAAMIQGVIRVLLIPGMTLGIGLLVGLSHTTIGGLLIWSTTSGGGISYILSAAVDGNEQLTIFLELASAAMGIVFTPLWIYIASSAMLDIFDDDADAMAGMGWLFLWLIALNIPVLVGIAIREYYPLFAHIFIAWILRPSMLLFFILFITLGVYSNLTVIVEITTIDIVSLSMVITISMLIALVVSRFLGWPDSVTKALISQQCSSNILLGLALCRLALRSPERDAFTRIIFLAVFCSPMPFFLIKICLATKNQIGNLYARQHQQQVSIAGGLADVVKTTLVNRAEERAKQDINAVAGYFMKTTEADESKEKEEQTKDIVSAL